MSSLCIWILNTGNIDKYTHKVFFLLWLLIYLNSIWSKSYVKHFISFEFQKFKVVVLHASNIDMKQDLDLVQIKTSHLDFASD